jgi:hypothetical protein
MKRRSSGIANSIRNNNNNTYQTLEPLRGQTAIMPGRVDSQNNRITSTRHHIENHVRASSVRNSD